jgi:hypothetical protein
MCYQLPGEITYDGLPIPGGLDINGTDFKFAGTVYPKVLHSATDDGEAQGAPLRNDWPRPRT